MSFFLHLLCLLFVGFWLVVLYLCLPVREKKGGNKETAPKAHQLPLVVYHCDVCGNQLVTAGAIHRCGAVVCLSGDCYDRHLKTRYDDGGRYA